MQASTLSRNLAYETTLAMGNFVGLRSAKIPLSGWPHVQSLKNLVQDGVLAQIHDQWPLTLYDLILYDLDVKLLKALAPIFATLSEKALGFHGTPGARQTPVARAIAMALSQQHIRKVKKKGKTTPSFRQLSEFDFFRGQSGSADFLKRLIFAIYVTFHPI